jgi:lipid-A-disaccharide synthase
MPSDSPSRPLRVLLSAGEASGEMYGAELIAALREMIASPTSANCGQMWATTEFFGLGGERMREAGCELVVEAREVAVVGLFEVLSHLPRIYRHFHRLLAEVDRRRPDVAVLIDFPDWNLRLAKQLHRRGIPVVYYVSPQLWAWRRWRVKLVQRYVSQMLVIFPFEQDFYSRHGVQVEFVGHPLGELEPPGADEVKSGREGFAQRWGLDPSRQWIALLPGSRRKELRMNLPAMLGAARRLGADFQYLMPVASTLDRDWVQTVISFCEDFWDDNHPRSGFSPQPIHLTDDARASLLHARVGVVASGTATVEAALIGTPFVMVYRLGRLTWNLGRRLVKLPYYGMVNLIAGREVVPELIQERFTPEAVEYHVRAMLEDGPARQRMLDALAEVRERLRGAPAAKEKPAQRAARAVLRVAERAAPK